MQGVENFEADCHKKKKRLVTDEQYIPISKAHHGKEKVWEGKRVAYDGSGCHLCHTADGGKSS